MAAVSSYTNGRGYSSHQKEDREERTWDLNGSINNRENNPSNAQRFARNQQASQTLNFDPPIQPKTPDLGGPNGLSLSPSKAGETFDPSYLSPKRGLRPGFNESRSGSEADSLLDLYGHPRSHGGRSAENSMDKERGMPHEELFLDDEDPERSRWIHRDKLAVIERHEMKEAGIELPPQQQQQQVAARSASKSKPQRELTHEITDLPDQEAEMVPRVERKKRRTRSPVRQTDESEEVPENDFDLRTPEEIAAEHDMENSPTVYRQPDLRKSSSRIPLPRSTPMPIPQEHIERETPLPRKRGASGNWTGDENGISYNRVRSRGNSVGSQVLLDDPEIMYNTPTPASRPPSRDSPSKSRIPSNKPILHTRKPSITNTPPNAQQQQKSRTPSVGASPRTPTSLQRPKSRSGLEPRPTTGVNRPEGEAPWLATMYKPDPRLPPEQQILPTHAKRLQQEQEAQAQREAEQRRLDGKASPQLPREFSPLAEHTVNGLQPSSRDADEKAMKEDPVSEWPLTVATPTNQKSGVNGTGPPIAAVAPPPLPLADANQHAGYSTIPRVKQGGSPVSPMGNQRVLDPFEKEKIARAEKEKGGGGGAVDDIEGEKDKGCGCCIVM